MGKEEKEIEGVKRKGKRGMVTDIIIVTIKKRITIGPTIRMDLEEIVINELWTDGFTTPLVRDDLSDQIHRPRVQRWKGGTLTGSASLDVEGDVGLCWM